MANEFIVRKGLISIGGDVIINRDNGSYNFNVEGSTDVNLFSISGSLNNVAIGGGNPSDAKLYVVATRTVDQYGIYVLNNTGTATTVYGLYSNTGSSANEVSTGIYSIGIASKGQNIGGDFVASGTNNPTVFTSAIANIGVRGAASASAAIIEEIIFGTSYGGYFSATGVGSRTFSYGVYSNASANSSTITTTYGGYFLASGGTNNYGIWTTAPGGLTNNVALYTENGNCLLNQVSGNTGIGVPNPTAEIHIKAGTSTAGTAPLKLTTGPLLGTAEVGAVEYLNPLLYFTNGTAIRQRIPLIQFGVVTAGQARTLDAAYTNITGMSVSLGANIKYEIEVCLIINSSSGVGARGKLAYSTAGTALDQASWFSYLINDTNSILYANRNLEFNPNPIAHVFNVTTVASAGFFLKGYLTTVLAGTLTFQGGQSVSSSTTMYFEEGSFIKATVIG